MLFATPRIAEECRAFVTSRDVEARVVDFTMPDHATHIYAVLFPSEQYSVPKQFWQHTGLGISSRRAEHALALLTSHSATTPAAKPSNRHYAAKPARGAPIAPPVQAEDFERDQALFIEERFGRNLNPQAAEEAKRAQEAPPVCTADGPDDEGDVFGEELDASAQTGIVADGGSGGGGAQDTHQDGLQGGARDEQWIEATAEQQAGE